MIPEELANEILRNISISGTAEERVKPIIGGNLSKIITTSSGLPKIQSNVVSKFNLVLSQPERLSILNPFEIRCCLCKKVISYPCWYYNIKYAVNHFHYFICMNDKTVNARCYKRGI